MYCCLGLYNLTTPGNGREMPNDVQRLHGHRSNEGERENLA